MTQHAGGAPAAPFTIAHGTVSFAKPAGDVQNERHCKVSSVSSEHAGRVGHHDALGLCCGQIDVINPGAIARNQFQARRGSGDDAGIDGVRDSRHEHVAVCHCGNKRITGEGSVISIETRIEQFRHALFDSRKKRAGDADRWTFNTAKFGHGSD